jgi:LysM repeat protein
MPEAESPSDISQVSYTVQPGDTLWQISETFGVEVSDISRANQLTNPDLILPGQVLAIPQP